MIGIPLGHATKRESRDPVWPSPVWPSMDPRPRGAISGVPLGEKTIKVAPDGVAANWRRPLKPAGLK